MIKITIMSFLLSLTLLTALSAQSANSSELKISLNHLALHVQDLEKSGKFYNEVIGLTRIPEPFKLGLHDWFSMGGSSQLHLIAGAEEPQSRHKKNHLCFTTNSIDDFIENLDKHNIQWTNWDGEAKKRTIRVDGVTQIYFKDPDGYWIEINNDGYVKR